MALHAYESWGEKGREDPYVANISDILEQAKLIDVKMTKNAPTWFNGRKGKYFIGKRIDRFVISFDLIIFMGDAIASIEDLIISDLGRSP